MGSSGGLHLLDLTCDQVLVLVDVKLDATQTLGGVGVDVLHVLDLVEAFVHLKHGGMTSARPRSPRLDSDGVLPGSSWARGPFHLFSLRATGSVCLDTGTQPQA